MTTPAAHPGSRWVVLALQHVFAGSGGPSIPVDPTVPWSAVVQAMVAHRVVGTLAPHAGEFGCPPEIVAGMHRLHLLDVGRGMKLVHETSTVSAALAASHVDHLVVKGACLAAQVGGRPIDRGGGDVDVWVRPCDVGRAERALAMNGWTRSPLAPTTQPEQGWRWRWLLHSKHEYPLRPDRDGVDVDLHWRLFDIRRGLFADFDAAFTASVPSAQVGPTVRTLQPTHALEHVAAHARKEMWPALRQVVDVIRVAAVCGPEVVGDLAERSRDVRLAVAMAACLDERFASWIPPLARADRRLVDESWAVCLGFGSYELTHRAASGVDVLRLRWGRASWLVRSAPGWAERRAHVLDAAYGVPNVVRKVRGSRPDGLE